MVAHHLALLLTFAIRWQKIATPGVFFMPAPMISSHRYWEDSRFTWGIAHEGSLVGMAVA